MNMLKKYYLFSGFIILGILLLYFVGMNSMALTDPDEVFYAETAREMLTHKSFLIPLIFEKPQFEKPPLFYWLILVSFKVFGVGTLAARFVTALLGIIGIFGTYLFVNKIFNKEISLMSTLILATSALYFGMSRSAITDIVFSVMVIFTLYAFYTWYKFRKNIFLVLFAIFSALAVLTKGPAGIIIPLFVILLFLLLSKDRRTLKSFIFNRWWWLFLFLALPWYIYVSLKYGKSFMWEFFIHNNWHRILYAEHRGVDRWYFYPCVMLWGIFPWTFYLLMVGRHFKKHKTDYLFLFCWIGTVFLMFQCAHSKLASYILPLFPAVAITLSISLSSLERKYKRLTVIGILYILSGIGMILPAHFFAGEYPDLYLPVMNSICVLALALVISGTLLVSGKFRGALFTTFAGFVLFMLVLSFGVPQKLETAFCDKDMVKLISEYNYSNKPVVCSKMYVRGVYFYTLNPVMVIDSSPKPFWSEHPLRIISRDEEILEFFKNKDLVLCVLDEGDLRRINKLFKEERINTIISQNFDRSVIVSRRR